MNCINCGKILEKNEIKLFKNMCKKCVINDIKNDIRKNNSEKIKTKINKKPSNVIYVVSRPQPGQVRGDWAVRGHGKIYSHHRTKEKAIQNARIIARERSATVMVQRTNGTFSKGFKPR